MQSMTGYGRSEVRDEQLHFTIEMRSVNHRYLDISLRYPRVYAPLETRMKQLMGDYFTRGRIEVTVAQQALGASDRAVTLDHALAQQYHRALNQLQEGLRLPGTVDLNMLLTLREILKIEEVETDVEDVWKLMQIGFEQASEALQHMRLQEGAFLVEDLRSRLELIGRHIASIRQRVPLVITTYRERLEERIAELFQVHDLDPDRLHQEVILLAERTDVAEELTRLEAHLQAMTGLLEAEGAIGRKVEFLLQEVNREVNTIASKSNDAEISQVVVEIKSELERMREQIQNVE
ncbi:YicC family protein [Candidatus Entotheonella serta]|nr:YicC family protein [Candidatus Entotheonella serta]